MKIRENVKRTIGNVLIATSTLGMTLQSRMYQVLCDDAFDQAGTAMSNVQTKLVTLAGKAFPLALIVCFFLMFFTRDQKKFQTEAGFAIGLVVVYLGILLVSKGTVTTTVQNLLNAVS